MVERFRVFRGATELSYSNIKIEKTNDHVINRINFSMEADANVTQSSSIDVRKSDGTTSVISGKVDAISENVLWDVRVLTNGYEMMNKRMQQVYLNSTPEAIIQDAVDTYTDNLTYTGTEVSGFTISKFIVDGYVIDIIKQMLDILRWNLRIDASDNVVAEPKGTLDNSFAYTNGTNCQIKKYDTDKGPEFYNRVEVTGAIVTRFSSETVTATDTEFTLAFKPVGVVKATVSGVEQTMTSPTEPYVVSAEEKKVTFSSSKTDPTFDYEYQQPLIVDTENVPSISSHGEVFKKLNAQWIDTYADLRQYAKELVSVHGQPTTRVLIEAPNLDFDREPGELITVTDSIRGKGSVKLVISKVTLDAASNMTIVEAGERTSTYSDDQRAIHDKLKELSLIVQDQDEIAFNKLFVESIQVDMAEVVTWEQNSPVDSFILGHPTLGRLRSGLDLEADCSDNGNHGTWNGTDVTLGTQYSTDGYRLSCGSFNGSDHFVNVPDDATLDLTGDCTIAVGVRVATLPSAVRTLLDKRRGSSTNGYSVQITAANKVSFTFGTATSAQTITADTTLTVDTWYHFIFTKTSTSLAAFTNGVADGTATAADGTIATNGSSVWIGKDGSNFTTGDIDEVRVYDAQLSASAALDLYNKIDIQEDMQLYLSFDNPRLGDRSSSRVTI